jgi:DNA-binding PadR family transcriptional regulator
MGSPDPMEFVPLSATDLQLLLSLTDGALHGYAISKSVRERSGGRVRIGLGSLYRIIARLSSSRLVEECAPEIDGHTASPTRRMYCLTDLGRAVLRAEVNRLADAITMARASELFVEEDA